MNTARIGVVVAALSAALVGCATAVVPSATRESSQSQPASPALAASPTTSPAATRVEEGSLPVLPLPRPRGSPAGEYGWEGGLGDRSGMHRVIGVDNDYREATAMMFQVGPRCLEASQTQQVPVRVAGLEGVVVEPYLPIASFGGAEPSMVTRAYALAVGARTICLYLTWNSATTPEELTSAEGILVTLRAEPIGESRIRLVFRLEAGWDTG